jgi:predicted ATPase
LGFSLWDFERDLRGELQNIEFIGPFRKNPERIYPFSGETPSSVGVHGDDAVSILVSDEFLQRQHKQNLVQKISQWFQKSGIARAVKIVPISERHFEVRLTHFDTSENENIADAGYGCSQILPILVAGFYRAKQNTLIIAQPEIHLHPRAEAEVGSFLCEVARRNIQLFVETHGVHLILRLQSHVASGELSPDDINVFCVYSDRKENKKHCRRIPIGKDGFFKEEWPTGFFPERLEEAKRLARFSL